MYTISLIITAIFIKTGFIPLKLKCYFEQTYYFAFHEHAVNQIDIHKHICQDQQYRCSR